MSMQFACRNDLSELMDTEPVNAEDFAICLRDLATVNKLTLAQRPTFSWLNRVAETWPKGRTLSILDVGFGQGDMLRAIWRWAQRRGIAVQLAGIDLNPLSEVAARQATPADMPVQFTTGDIFSLSPGDRFDVIISSLVTHHMSDAQIVDFLRLMDRQAVCGWFVNDLHRHPLPYHLFRLWAATAGWHRFVRHDGPVSILRSFRRADWERYIGLAGVEADIVWHMPFRYGVGHCKVMPA
ncbi:methyltransferase domain-containing protein [Dongia sp.]|uniref:methyltransferase domain-containing protein n=1 Tax=Dongia sp. TaxID=1977262 RepID=UPI0035B11F97